MADSRARLLRSFAAVFPELSEAQLESAGLGALEAWDSVATITLLSLVEEEFGVSFEPEDLGRLTSFTKILDHLETKGAS